jgi:hypothetical protein
LTWCTEITDAGLVGGFEGAQTSTLKLLSLYGNTAITNDAYHAIMKHKLSLETLDLNGCVGIDEQLRDHK